MNDQQALHYYKHREMAEKTILKIAAKNGQIIYGARAINAYLPPYLDKHTEDYDIFTRNPKRTAIKTEKTLDKQYRGNYFYVKPAEHEGTYKVKSTVTNRTVADYTDPHGNLPFNVISGNRYVPLYWSEKQIKKSLRDKESSYRHDKDREALKRIHLFRHMKWKSGKKQGKLSLIMPRFDWNLG